MGERGNIHLIQEDIWFYTHWRGYMTDEIVAMALDRGRGRWTDPTYLNRIIFCQLVKGREMEDTGFGIARSRTDWNYDDTVVNTATLTVGGVPFKAYADSFVEFSNYNHKTDEMDINEGSCRKCERFGYVNDDDICMHCYRKKHTPLCEMCKSPDVMEGKDVCKSCHTDLILDPCEQGRCNHPSCHGEEDEEDEEEE